MRDDMAKRLDDMLNDIHAEMRGVRSELGRLRMLDHAMLAERDPEHWLN